MKNLTNDTSDSIKSTFHCKISKKPNLFSIFFGSVVGILVCLPFFGHGRLLLLDWVQGTNVPFFSTSFYGLNGGLTTSVLISLVLAFLNVLVGGASTWVPFLLFFPLATFSIGRLVGGGAWRRLAAGILFVVNPFVFNRIFVGQIALLIGYALLPLAISTLINSATADKNQWLKLVLWWALLTSLSPHFVWIFGLPIGVLFLYELSACRQKISRTVLWLFSVISLYVVTISYLLVPSLFTTLPSTVGATSLNLYKTVADPFLGLIPNVIGMYGFWRIGPGPVLPKNQIPGWIFLLIFLLAVASYAFSRSQTLDDSGISTVTRSRRLYIREKLQLHHQFIVIGLVGILGLLLSLGSQGPTGALFSWLYDHFAFFQIMREPQKFLMLWILCLSVFFAFGSERILSIAKSKWLKSLTSLVLCVGLPIAYAPTMFYGLNNQIALSSLPSAYVQADKLMGTGQGQILYLPWHLYMSYPFANNRVIANVASGMFSRGTITGDNVESGGVSTQSTSTRSAYLEGLYAKGSMINDFGSLVEPLGVQFIVLSKSSDWASYAWLNMQSDLMLVTDNATLMIWENTKFNSVNTSGTVKGIYSAGHRVFEQSPVSYEISSGKAGIVTTDIPFQKGWMFNGAQTTESPQGLVQVNVGEHGGTLRFAPWNAVLVGYIISGSMVLALATTIFLGKRNRTSRKDKAI